MVRISSEAFRLMSLYTPDELAKWVHMSSDGQAPATPPELSYQDRVALNRARIAEIDRQQAALEPDRPARPSEAETRGYSRRHKPTGPRLPRAPEDDLPATPLWLRDHFQGMYRLGPVWTVREARAGYPRHVWRAAVAGLLTVDRGDVRCVEWAMARVAKAIAEGETDDPRGASYQSYPSWPKALYEFALVPVPEKYEDSPVCRRTGAIAMSALFPAKA